MLRGPFCDHALRQLPKALFGLMQLTQLRYNGNEPAVLRHLGALLETAHTLAPLEAQCPPAVLDRISEALCQSPAPFTEFMLRLRDVCVCRILVPRLLEAHADAEKLGVQGGAPAADALGKARRMQACRMSQSAHMLHTLISQAPSALKTDEWHWLCTKLLLAFRKCSLHALLLPAKAHVHLCLRAAAALHNASNEVCSLFGAQCLIDLCRLLASPALSGTSADLCALWQRICRELQASLPLFGITDAPQLKWLAANMEVGQATAALETVCGSLAFLCAHSAGLRQKLAPLLRGFRDAVSLHKAVGNRRTPLGIHTAYLNACASMSSHIDP